MANPQHLEILKKGVAAWNQWRMENPDVRPNLREAKLISADLRGVNFWMADLNNADLTDANLSDADLILTMLGGALITRGDLSRANLSRADLNSTDLTKANLNNVSLDYAYLDGARLGHANLSNARLVQAYLFRADLINANFESANLQAADLRDADLTNANLKEAYLGGAIFNGANLSHAKMNGAEINDTVFGDNDLSVVEGLEEVKHGGASIIGISTLYRSSGNISSKFLRGCGVPENFITYIPSLFREAVQFYSCFISYSSKDTEVVTNIYRDLQNAGIRCWLAPYDLKAGDNIRTSIDDAINLSDKLLLVLSSNSIESKWVQVEVRKAREREEISKQRILFPIRLDDSVLTSNHEWAIKLREYFIVDFRNWENASDYKRALSRLIRDLRLSIAIESDESGAER